MSLFPQGNSIRELARGHLDQAQAPANIAEDAVIRLRIAIARIAQALGVQTEELPVIDKGFQALNDMAAGSDSGWHALAAVCTDKALMCRQLAAWNADGSRNPEV